MPPPTDSNEAFEARYHRKGLGLRREARKAVSSEYASDWVQAFRANGFVLERGQTTLRLAREFGFCYGVERSVDYAYETLQRFPDRRIVITSEIIHNPSVNRRLRELGVRFLGDPEVPDVSALGPQDVVILPAFGVAVGAFGKVRETGAVVVDTTCGSVLNVWKNVERYARAGLTSLVHGKANHEETSATASRAQLYPDAHAIVVFDMEEAQLVATWIREGGDAEAFLERFPPPKTSPGFDPERHLQRIGVANQTTMLSSESIAISRLIGDALQDRYGDASDPARFRAIDTICSATHDRQEALSDLLEEPLDLLIVVGGFNSSNTGHLREIAQGRVPAAFHVENPECLIATGRIRHKPPGEAEREEAIEWLPVGSPLTVGLTAGASTPDAVVGAVVDRLLVLRREEAPAT